MSKYRTIEDIKHGEILIGKPGEAYIVFKYRSPIENKPMFADSHKCPFCKKELLCAEIIEHYPARPDEGVGSSSFTTSTYKCECGYHSF